jgi:uncharacterized protein (TIGR02466 family)
MKKENDYFSSAIYSDFLPELLEETINLTDKIIQKEKLIQKQNYIDLKTSRSLKENEITDHGWVYHSQSLLKYSELLNLTEIILKNSYNILSEQGYNLKNYNLYFNEYWVQEFPTSGGGSQDTHIHGNSHISGFYFLKCSNKTSFPIFHDPRAAKIMSQLPEKNENNITLASEKINFKPSPGTLLMFNSYLPHQFVVDDGIEPFRFIHFNIQATKNYEQL